MRALQRKGTAMSQTAMSQMAEMDRLTKELSQASKFRMSAVDEMRRATKATLSACATMRGEMARRYRAQTQRFLASLAKDVSAHRHATTTQMMRVASARRKVASEMRGDLEGHVLGIMERTAEIRNAATAMGAGLSTAHREMAKRQKGSLDAGRDKLRADVAGFLGSVRRHQQAVRADLVSARNVWSAFALGEHGDANVAT